MQKLSENTATYLKQICFAVMLLISCISFNADAKKCVLSLYDKSTRESKMFDNVFSFDPQIDYIKMAQLEDILKCFESDEYSEIVWLSHGLSTRLGLSNYSAPLFTEEGGARTPLYLNFFRNLISKVNYNTLRKVRIEVCNVDYSGKAFDLSLSDDQVKIHSTLDLLIRDLKKHNIEVDLSPIFEFGKWVLNEDVTRVTYEWLSQSIDRDRLTKWRTGTYSYCFDDNYSSCDRRTAKMTIPIAPMLP